MMNSSTTSISSSTTTTTHLCICAPLNDELQHDVGHVHVGRAEAVLGQRSGQQVPLRDVHLFSQRVAAQGDDLRVRAEASFCLEQHYLDKLTANICLGQGFSLWEVACVWGRGRSTPAGPLLPLPALALVHG